MNAEKYHYKIAAIGPALTDALFHLDEEHYKNILVFLKVKAGDWIELKNVSDVYALFKLSGNKKESCMEDCFQAGSSLLGVLSAFPIELRKKSLLITSEGTSHERISQTAFSVFSKTVKALSVEYITHKVNGVNAIGMSFTSYNNPDRLLTMYKGISHDLKISDKDVCAEYLLVDAYELNGGSISESIDRLIRSKKYKTVLSLGNSSILQGSLSQKLMTYLQNGLIYCLAGNKGEFECLFGDIDISRLSLLPFIVHVPYVLMTLGERGMIGKFHEKVYYQQAIKTDNIISTSGCGDVSLGTFLSGIIYGLSPCVILEKAAYYASIILKRQSNVISEGIENLK